ncbi:MAG: hypothetical protein ACOC1X_04670 [Promethearchaeota archaeon]
MSKLLGKNGTVFDPLNSIEGEIKDILIEDGKIVESFTSDIDVNEIDATGKTVIPSGIDMHAHISSQQLNWARLLGQKNATFQKYWNGLSLRKIANDYISNGYTFVLDANVFPSLASQSIFNVRHLPVLDTGFLLNVSNLWALESQFQRNKVEETAVFLSDLMGKVKAFGIKLYNPFESEEWNFNMLRNSLEKDGKLYNYSALDVYEHITKAVEKINLPHSVHTHIEGYETEQAKANLKQVLVHIRDLNLTSQSTGDDNNPHSQIFHLAHCSSYNIDGDNSFLIEFLNNNNNFDTDLGLMTFDPINPLITSDRRLVNSYTSIENDKINYQLIRSSVESEGDSFTMLRKFEKNETKDCYRWSNALELALNIENKWQLQLTLNYPNYGDINKVPEVIAWLVSSEARKLYMQDMNEKFRKNNSLNELDQKLSFNDVLILRSASPAKSLGIAKYKGNLGIGSDGYLNILDIDVNDLDLENDYSELKSSFKNMNYVVKSGIVIKNRDKLNLDPKGKLFWSKGQIDIEGKEDIMSKKEKFYQKYYSVFYDSFQTQLDEKFLREI